MTLSVKDAAGSTQTIETLPAKGQALAAASLPVVLASDATVVVSPAATENHIGEVGGRSKRVTATFNRPANTTPYASGQLVANSVTAGSVTSMQLAVARINAGTGAITSVKLSKSSAGLSSASFRAHFYRNSPTASNGDGGAWLTTASSYLGYADVTIDKAFTDEASGSGVPKDSNGNLRSIIFDTAGGSNAIYALLEARGAYTPVSAETFTLTAEVIQD